MSVPRRPVPVPADVSHLSSSHRAYTIPREDLYGWCLQYRVRVYGYAGRIIPEEHLRESLRCAISHYGIYGRYWDQTGGLGRVYGAPGEPLPMSTSAREARAIEEYEEHQREQIRRANDRDYDYTQHWVYDL